MCPGTLVLALNLGTVEPRNNKCQGTKELLSVISSLRNTNK